MENLSDISVIEGILSRHGFNFSKALGQNFIVDEDVCPQMAKLSGADENKGVIEIGPGIGVLTVELAKKAKKVVSIELDARLIPVLKETLGEFENVKVINGDVMKLDLKKLIEDEFQTMDVVVCANLPYYITSPIITMLLQNKLPIESITVMIQKEAADRICAEVGTRNSGAITVFTNYYSKAQKLFDVTRDCFMPSPNVDSMVIRLDVRKEPPISVFSEKKFFSMVKAAFAQRRKTAVNSISSGLGIGKSQVADALTKCGLDVNIRAEKLTMNDLAELCESLHGE